MQSVTAARTRIAAGALLSDPHQTDVVVSLSRPVSTSVAVWLEGGRSYGTGTETLLGFGLNLEGPAVLSWNDRVFTAGDAKAVVVRTDEQGVATLRLTSSNLGGESCRVHARLGRDRSLKNSEAQSSKVVFEKGYQELDMPDYFAIGTTQELTVTRKHEERPLQGHDTVVYVKSVKVNGVRIEMDWRDPTGLSEYAWIGLDQIRQVTDRNGQVTAMLHIKRAEGLENVETVARDFQMFEARGPRSFFADIGSRLAEKLIAPSGSADVKTDPIRSACEEFLGSVDRNDARVWEGMLIGGPDVKKTVTAILADRTVREGEDWRSEVADFTTRKQKDASVCARLTWRRLGSLADATDPKIKRVAIRDFECVLVLVQVDGAWKVRELAVNPTKLALQKDVAARVTGILERLAQADLCEDESALLLCGAAYQFLMADQAGLAEVTARRATEERDSFATRFMLGMCLRMQGRYEQAGREFLKAAGSAASTPPLLRDAEKQMAECARLGLQTGGGMRVGDAADIERLIEDLGHKDPEAREKAEARLQGMGNRAIPFLKAHMDTGDAEIGSRARRILGDLGALPYLRKPAESGKDPKPQGRDE